MYALAPPSSLYGCRRACCAALLLTLPPVSGYPSEKNCIDKESDRQNRETENSYFDSYSHDRMELVKRKYSYIFSSDYDAQVAMLF